MEYQCNGKQTKIRIFNSNISETWWTIKINTIKIQTVINNCLRRNVIIHWILWQYTKQGHIWMQTLNMWLGWIGQGLRAQKHSKTSQVLTWNSQGKRTRGRPNNFWRCDHIADKEVVGYSWGEIERMAQDRRRWRAVIGGLCPSRT